MEPSAGSLLFAAAAVFAGLTGIAIVTDIRKLEIPNWASVGIAALFAPAAALSGLEGLDILRHYGVGFAFLAGGALLFSLNVLGGGDAKLLAAVVVWFDGATMGALLFLIAVLGGLVALVVIVVRRFPSLQTSGLPWLAAAGEPHPGIPYGVAIGLAALYQFPLSPASPPALAGLFGL